MLCIERLRPPYAHTYHDGDERPDAFSDHRGVFVVFRETHEQVVRRTALPQEWCHASQMLVWARVNFCMERGVLPVNC